MRRAIVRASSSLLAAVAALVLSGCGSEQRAAAPPAAPEAVPAQRAAVTPERTDGRLGDATSATSDGERTLERGGRIRPGAGAPPRGVREGVDGAASCGAVDAQPTAESMGAVSGATLCLLNLERTSRGLVALAPNAKLNQAADAQAADMVARKYFAHESPEGTSPADRIRSTGYIPADASWTVGENLAWGTGALATPAAIVRAWMNSPGHRDNLLKPDYREIGLAIRLGVPKEGLDGGATYATTFGAVEGAETVPVEASAPVAAKPAAPAVAKPAAAKPKASAAASRAKARAAARRKAARARAARARAARARAARARAARARAARAARSAQAG